MPVDTVNMGAAFDTLRDAVAEEFSASGDGMVADIREMLNVPVSYTAGPRGGKKTIRSVTPQPPRRETGALWESISRAVEVGLYGVEMVVFTDKRYSASLQSEGFISGPRLHWSTLYENWLQTLPERVTQKIAEL